MRTGVGSAVAATAIACAFVVSGCGYKPSWREVREDGYVVQLPGDPKLTTQTDHQPGADAHLKLRIAGFFGATEFGVGRLEIDAPGKFLDPDTMLDAMMDGAVKKANVSVTKRERIMLDIHRGLEVEGHTTTEPALDMVIRLYWQPPSTGYLVMLSAKHGSAAWQDRGVFFDSFHITAE